jgi:hypothetical protein
VGGAQGGAREPSWRFLPSVVGWRFIEGSAKEIHGRGKGSSRNVRHKQPVTQQVEFVGTTLEPGALKGDQRAEGRL